MYFCHVRIFEGSFCLVKYGAATFAFPVFWQVILVVSNMGQFLFVFVRIWAGTFLSLSGLEQLFYILSKVGLVGRSHRGLSGDVFKNVEGEMQ